VHQSHPHPTEVGRDRSRIVSGSTCHHSLWAARQRQETCTVSATPASETWPATCLACPVLPAAPAVPHLAPRAGRPANPSAVVRPG